MIGHIVGWTILGMFGLIIVGAFAFVLYDAWDKGLLGPVLWFLVTAVSIVLCLALAVSLAVG